MQSDFGQALLDPDAPTPRGLVDPQNNVATRRFSVYRNNVISSLIEALEAAFPVTHSLVGEAFFKGMAGVFVRQHPPVSPLMTYYGSALPGFLRNFAPAQSLPYLSDVAQLEVLTRESLHAADAIAAPETLGAIPQERLADVRLTFLPSVRLQASAYPVLSILEKALGHLSGPLPKQGEDLLFARPEMSVTSHRLPAGGATFLTMLSDGQSLGKAADAMPENFNLSETLTTLLTAGAITGATLP